MTEAYDPAKDVAADGLKRVADTPELPDDGTALSRAAWNAGQSGAPSSLDNPTFKKWGKRILWVVLAAVGFWVGSEMIAAYRAYSAKIEEIEKPQAAEPERPTPPKKKVRKSATEKAADKASNTPSLDSYPVEITENEQSTVVIKPGVMRTWGEHPVPPLPPAPLN